MHSLNPSCWFQRLHSLIEECLHDNRHCLTTKSYFSDWMSEVLRRHAVLILCSYKKLCLMLLWSFCCITLFALMNKYSRRSEAHLPCHCVTSLMAAHVCIVSWVPSVWRGLVRQTRFADRMHSITHDLIQADQTAHWLNKHTTLSWLLQLPCSKVSLVEFWYILIECTLGKWNHGRVSIFCVSGLKSDVLKFIQYKAIYKWTP